MIQACSLDGFEIVFRDPSSPVILKDGERGIVVYILSESIFIHDV